MLFLDPCAQELAALNAAMAAVVAADSAYIDALADSELALDAYENCEFNSPGQCGQEESVSKNSLTFLQAAGDAVNDAAADQVDASEDYDECCGGGGPGSPEEPEEPEEPELFASPANQGRPSEQLD